MDTKRIISDIDTEISKLQQARALLSGVKSTKNKTVAKSKKRKLSAKGRAAISAAMKARWAKKRATA
jgi:low affinity Fe/Cu permease